MSDELVPDPEPTQQAEGGFDLSSILDAAMSMKSQVEAGQAEIAATVVTGTAGGGGVTIEVSGDMSFKSVSIDPSLIDPSDPSMLEDLVLAALRDGVSKIGELQAEADPMAGMDLGALGGLGGLLGQGDG